MLLASVVVPAAQGVRERPGTLVGRDGVPVELRSHRIEAVVEDGLARTTLRQTFRSTRPGRFEAVYRFPLPEDASLVDVAMEVDGERLEGLLADRRVARRLYDDIVRRERDPGLVEQVRANLFRLSVFPVVQDVDTVVELTWVEQLPLEDGTFTYVLPLGVQAVQVARDLTATVRMHSSVPLREPRVSHRKVHVLQPSKGEVVFSLESIGSTLYGDVTLQADVAVQEPELSVRTFHDGGDGGWFLALVTPPRSRAVRARSSCCRATSCSCSTLPAAWRRTTASSRPRPPRHG